MTNNFILKKFIITTEFYMWRQNMISRFANLLQNSTYFLFVLFLFCYFPHTALSLEFQPSWSDSPQPGIIFIDEPGNLLPPDYIIPYEYYITIRDLDNQITALINISISPSYSVIAFVMQKDGSHRLRLTQKSRKTLEKYRAVEEEYIKKAMPRGNGTELYATKNWAKCVDCVVEFIECYTDVSPYILARSYGNGIGDPKEKLDYLKKLRDGEAKAPDTPPEGMFWLHASEIRPFLLGQLEDKLPEAVPPAPEKDE